MQDNVVARDFATPSPLIHFCTAGVLVKKTVFKILRNILFKQTEETSQGLAQVKPRVDQGKIDANVL